MRKRWRFVNCLPIVVIALVVFFDGTMPLYANIVTFVLLGFVTPILVWISLGRGLTRKDFLTLRCLEWLGIVKRLDLEEREALRILKSLGENPDVMRED